MKTDDLIALLSDDLKPAPRGLVGRACWRWAWSAAWPSPTF